MLNLIVGNTGAGKTTYSNELQQSSKAVVFSIDQWNRILFLPDKSEKDGLDWFLERIDREESLMMNMIDQLERVGIDSILDLGFAKPSHREKFRNFARRKGYEHQIHFLNVPKEIRFERVMKRNEEKGDSFEFEVTEANFEFMENWFEAPDSSEMSNGRVITN